MISFAVRGEVKLVSAIPVLKKPNVASIGGFTVKDDKGEEIFFDWLSHMGNADITPEGFLEIEWDLREFDCELYLTSNENAKNPDWSLLTKSILDEVSYEAYEYDDISKEESDNIPMNLAEFKLYVYEYGIHEFEFSQEQIDAYNKKIEEQRSREQNDNNANNS